jgi:hypothetical protein
MFSFLEKITIMKNTFTLLMMMIAMTLMAQSKMFIHTATSDNSSAAATMIDHPDLNGNPNAGIIIAHNWNPGGEGGVYNDHVSGVWYDGAKWWIFNQDLTNMIMGSKYNVFVGSSSNTYLHQATSSNSTDYYTLLPSQYTDQYLFYSTYYPAVYNNKRYAWDYFGSTRYLYTPSFEDIPNNARFIIYQRSDEVVVTHITGASNIVGNWTIIDHPLLNGNPDATFVFCHFYGINGPETQINIDKNLGVWYDGSKWAIYTEDQSAMPSGLAFDIMIAANEMSTNEVLVADKINVYPNPVKEVLKITSDKAIQKVQVLNMTGQIVLEAGEVESINMQSLPKGLYIVNIYTSNQLQSKKVLKE